MAVIDYLIVAAYFGFLLAATFVKKWNKKADLDYLLAGRRLTLVPFVATLVTTAYGWILGTGELYYTYGISAWLFLNLPYTIFSLLLAFFFAKKARSGQFETLPGLLDNAYNRRVANLGTFFVLLFTSPAMYVLMAAQVIASMTGMPVLHAIAMALIFSTVYIYSGGFQTIVKTDLLKFVLMFGGFIAVFVTLFYRKGLAPLQGLDTSLTTFHIEDQLIYIIGWFLMASMVLADPSFHQRIYAVEKPSVAKKGLLISVLFWTLFDFLAASLALYARAELSGLENPAYAFPELARTVLPEGIRGLFFVGLLSTIMSTSDGFLFISSLSISHDLLQKNGFFTRIPLPRLNGFMLAFVSLVTFAIVYLYRDKTSVNIFFDFNPIVVSALVVPVVCSFFACIRLPGRWVFWQMAGGALIAVLCTVAQKNGWVKTMANPAFFGMGFAVLFQVIGQAFRRKDAEADLK